jgi:hypothetical protein
VGSGCGTCGVVYLTLAVALLPAPVGATSGTKLVCPGMAEVDGMVEIGMGPGV